MGGIGCGVFGVWLVVLVSVKMGSSFVVNWVIRLLICGLFGVVFCLRCFFRLLVRWVSFWVLIELVRLCKVWMSRIRLLILLVRWVWFRCLIMLCWFL